MYQVIVTKYDKLIFQSKPFREQLAAQKEQRKLKMQYPHPHQIFIRRTRQTGRR